MDPDWDGAGLLGSWVEMRVPLNADQVLLVPSVLWHLICLRLLNIFLLCVHMLSFFFFFNSDSCKCADPAVLLHILKSVNKQI